MELEEYVEESDEVKEGEEEEVGEVEEEVEEEETVSEEEETEARRMGWSPQDEWRGDPKLWKDAKTFLRHGQEILPIVRSENKKLRVQNEQISKDTEKLRSMVKALKKTIEEGSQSNYDEMLSTLKAKRREALRGEDLPAVADIDDQIDALEKRPPAKIEEEKTPEVHPDVHDWIDKTSWYREDEDMTDYMEFQFAKNLRKYGNSDVKLLLRESEKAVKKQFSTKFHNPRRDMPNGIEAGSRGGSKRDAFSNLPAEAKSAFKSMIDDGTFEDTPEDRAFYAKEYNQ